MVKWDIALLVLLLILVACSSPTSARTVTVLADGKTREIATEALTVRELLTDASIRLDADDRVEPVEPTLLHDGMTVHVIRVETRTETEEREIPFDRRTVQDASIPTGETQLLEPGVTGHEELTYRVTLEDNVEIDRRLIRRVTVREPRTEVILIGIQTKRQPVSMAGTIAYIANQNAWVMRRTNRNQRRLTYQGDLDGRVFALSPDGSHLLFTRVPTETGESAPINTLWAFNTSVVDARPTRLAIDSVLWAGWEPDCNVANAASSCRIAYTTGTRAEGNPGWRANNDLWIARPRPSTGELVAERQVLKPAGGGPYGWWGTSYAWSPDGQTLAYARAEEVGVIRAYDGQQTTLARFSPYRTYAPWVWVPSVAWSPEGDFIVTTVHGPAPTGEASEDSPVFDVWALASDGTITAELSSEAGMWSVPAFGPEADYLAFARARSPYASQTSSYDLYITDRDGSDRRIIFPPHDEIGLAYPQIAWGPKGDQIAFIYQENLYAVSLQESRYYQLTEGGGVTAVRWQRGSTISSRAGPIEEPSVPKPEDRDGGRHAPE